MTVHPDRWAKVALAYTILWVAVVAGAGAAWGF